MVVAAAPNSLLNKADKAIHPLIPAPPELFDNIDFSPHSPLHNQSHYLPPPALPTHFTTYNTQPHHHLPTDPPNNTNNNDLNDRILHTPTPPPTLPPHPLQHHDPNNPRRRSSPLQNDLPITDHPRGTKNPPDKALPPPDPRPAIDACSRPPGSAVLGASCARGGECSGGVGGGLGYQQQKQQ